MPMNTMRFSTPSMTLMFGVCASRGTSCGGGSLMRSTSPEMSAATRVASETIGV